MHEHTPRLYTAAQVRELDRLAIEDHGVAGYTLMCRAGQAVFEAAREEWPHAHRWLVVCGAGNNGGDGFEVARMAHEQGLSVTVIALRPVGDLTGDAAWAAKAWLDSGGEVEESLERLPAGVDLVVDALLGTGLDREVTGNYRAAIEAINRLDRPCVAVDIPSGIHADTGQVMGVAVRAGLTVTFIGRKRGLFTAEGPDHCGRVEFEELGTHALLGEALQNGGTLDSIELLQGWLPRRRRNAHKGHFGHVLVVGGAPGTTGAARLAGEAALRAGAGLVSVASHPSHAGWLNLARPELMVHGVAEPGDLDPLLERANVVVVGPGLGLDSWGRALLEPCVAAKLPLVVDADGLNLLAAAPVQRLADRYGSVVVLKGCGTVVGQPGGDWSVCPLGNPGMATAGTGDVLTGVVGAMLAQGLEPWVAARAAVLAHAAAGDLAAARGERGILASEISDCLPAVVNGPRF